MDRVAPLATEDGRHSRAFEAKTSLEDLLLQPSPGGLPYEPPSMPQPGAAGPEPKEVLRQLLNFFLFARRPAGQLPPEPGIIPALLHKYRELASIRHDYPFCLHGSASADAVGTLSQIIDELVRSVTAGGEDGERLQQHIYRIEPEIRGLAGKDSAAGLLGLWDRAAKQLLARSRLSQAKKEQLRENLATARKALPDVEMIACGDAAPQRLLAGLALRHWRERCSAWRAELDALIQQLSDLLSIEFNNSPGARNPEHLRDATATGDAIDYTTLSSILAGSNLDHNLPEARGQRIRAALTALLQIKPLMDGGSAAAGTPLNVSELFDNCKDAITAYQQRLGLITEFFKAVAIARLELENRYKEPVHDEYFAGYDSSYLGQRELSLCPPVLLKLKCSTLARADVAALLHILAGAMPVKILLQVDDLYLPWSHAQASGITINWPARLASMAMSMTRAYVLQSPLSRLQVMQRGFLAGLDYGGPALFSVYVGNAANQGGLPRFFDAGAALESRIFPVFTFNPGNGSTLLERLDISENSQLDRDWPSDVFRFRAADESEQSLQLKFTTAGFLLNDRRFIEQYWCVPPEYRHENMVPLPDYLSLDDAAAANRIPYIRCVDADGCIHQVIMTRHVVAMVRECAASWRQLQEQGGVNNSWALQQVAAEKDRLAAVQQQELAAIEERYRMQMENDIGKLTEVIVGRIAQQLLQTGAAPIGQVAAAAPVLAPVPPPPQAAPVTAAEPARKPAAVEEDEAEPAVALDDPYIDTPLCTSCNDCTKVNAQLFGYDANKQAYIKDAAAGTYKDLVRAAEICPVKIIHPGKPRNPDEPGLDELLKRAAPFM
jgi:ferredoxin